jgi:hypothetical protein
LTWTGFSEAQIKSDSLLGLELQYFKTQDPNFLWAKVYYYKQHLLFEEALTELKRIEVLDFKALREKTLLLYLKGNFKTCLQTAQVAKDLALSFQDSLEISQIIFFAALEQKDYTLCRQIAQHIFENDPKLPLLLERLEAEPKFLSVHKAEILQQIFPGLGQAYAGKKGKAFWSFTLQAGSLLYLVSSFLTHHYASGVLTGGGLWFRFYTGGIRHARWLAEQENTKRSQIFNQSIKQTFFEK